MLRILTANLLHVHADPGAFADLVDRVEPDVVALQELDRRIADVVSARFPHIDLEPTDDPRGMGIATATPTTFARVPLPHTDGWAASLEDGTEIVSVHVRNPVDLPPIEANTHRRRQIEAIVDHVAARDGRMVVAGDFNATSAWPAYRRIREVLDDAVVQAVGTRSKELRTWGPRLLGGRKLLRIDHVFVRGFRGVTARAEEVAGSDHAAVVVDLEPITEGG